MAFEIPGGNPPLDANTFEQCYKAIAWNLSLETPLNPFFGVSAVELRERAVAESMRPLDRWREYAMDGDLGGLVTVGDKMPWDHLRTVRTADLQDNAGVLDGTKEVLAEAWTGSAAAQYASYLSAMQIRVGDYAGQEGYVAETAALLEAAFATRLAFKRDLLELARNTNDALKALDDGSPWKTVGLICLALGSLALNALVPMAAGTTVAGLVSGAIVSKMGDIAYSAATSQLDLGGDTAAEIMKSLDAGVSRVLAGYESTASALTKQMDAVLVELRAASSLREGYPEAPYVDPKTSLGQFQPRHQR